MWLRLMSALREALLPHLAASAVTRSQELDQRDSSLLMCRKQGGVAKHDAIEAGEHDPSCRSPLSLTQGLACIAGSTERLPRQMMWTWP